MQVPSGSSYETILWSLLAKDNATRNAAEAHFATLKQATCSDELLLGLVHLVHSNSADDVRALAAVLLRRVLLRDTVSLWPQATDRARSIVKCELLAVLEAGEKHRSIRRKVCDTVGELASSILEDGQWDELVPKLIQWSQATMVTLRETALRVLEMIAVFLASQMTLTTVATTRLDGSLLETMIHGLNDREGRVALNALRAFGMFLLNVDTLDQVPRPELVTRAVPLVLATLHALLVTRQFDEVMEALEVLIEVAEPHAGFFKPCLREFVETMVQIADASRDESDESPVPDGCRQLAMELLVSLAEQAPLPCRRLPKNMFVQQVYPVAFKMMLDVHDVDAWDVATCEDEQSSSGRGIDHEISNFDVGSEALERLVGALGAKRSLPTCFALIQKYAQSENWVSRHAALVGLCQIFNVLDDDHLDAIVRHLLSQAYDSHPRVCCIAVDVIGQISVDQAPQFQEAYHSQALSVLVHYLEDSRKPRLQAHAATALRQFVDMCPPEVLTPYLEKMLHQLFALLQHGQAMALNINEAPTKAFIAARVVQEQVITAISSVATVAGASFSTYYAAVLPPLQQILCTCLQECVTAAAASPAVIKSQLNALSSFTLGGITLECLSLIGQAVGKHVFSRDAAAILKVMAEMQATPSIVGNELIRTYLLQAWARCCTCLGRDFAPYLPLVMPTLLEAATQQAEFEVDPSALASDDEEEDSTDSEDIQLAQVNDKCLSIRTSLLEEKATACQLLAGMVTDLEDAFFPYAEQVTQVLVPLLTESVHSDIRASAIRAMPALVKCVAISTTTRPGSSEHGQATIKQMVDFALGRLINALTSEPDVDLVVTIMQSMIKCLNEACVLHPTLKLNDAQLRELVHGLLVVLGDTFQRRAMRRGGAGTDITEAGDDGDEDEDASQSSETQAAETEVHFVLAACIGTLAKTHGAAFFPVFMSLLWDKVTALAARGCLIEDRHFALYVVDDVLEHCGDAALRRLDCFLPLLLNALCEVNEPELIQAAAFGVGVCASHGGDSFAPHANSCLDLLHTIVKQPHAFRPEQRNATDNAIAALGKLCEFHADVVDAATLFPQWLELLPLRGDLEESLAVSRRLCSYVNDRHPLVLGAPNYRHLGKVVAVLAAVADATFLRNVRTSVGDKEASALCQEVASTLANLRVSVPEPVMKHAWASLSGPQKTALHALFA